jgi:hypothetical protein
MPGADGKSKQQQWLEAWCEMPEADKRPMNEMQFLSKFGIRHLPKNGSRNTITNGGIEPTIRGISYSYHVPPALYLPNVGKKVNVLYDPYDMSRVLVTDDEHLRFVARSTQFVPRAMADFNRGDRTYLNALLDEKRDDAKAIASKAAEREQTLRRSGIDAQGLLQAGVMLKELKQAAELEVIIDRDNYDPYDQA